MTAPTPAPDLIDRLADRLIAVFDPEECKTVDGLLEEKASVRFMRRARVRVGGYFDLAADLVIYDAALGTIGLVVQVSGTGDDLRAAQRKAINSATSLRQLLIEQADRGQDGNRAAGSRRLPLQVELLLVVDATASPNPGAPAAHEAERVLPDVLNEVAREGGYLRLIGIGVLRPERAEGSAELFADRALRRAFPWLLTATAKWFKRAEFGSDAKGWRTGRDGFQLRLRDYRAAGARQLKAVGGVSLQLLHGNNGTGKSSIAEALELLLTGRIERLEAGGESNYFLSVRHRPPGTDNDALQRLSEAHAGVWIGTDANPISAFTITKDGRQRSGLEPSGKLHVNSFRLDQVFMDALVRATPDRRAAMFLDAFSPTERAAIDAQRARQTEFRTGLAALAPHTRTAAPTEETAQFAWVQEQFGWLRAPDVSDSPAASTSAQTDPIGRRIGIEALLPIPFDDLRIAARGNEPLLNLIASLESASTREALSPLAGRFDEALAQLVESVKQGTGPLRATLRILEEFRSWAALGQVSRGASFKADLDDCLESQALLDLYEKRCQIVETIASAEQRGWRVEKDDAVLVRGDRTPSLAADLAARKAAIDKRLQDAQSRLHQWLKPEPATPASGTAAAPTRRRLSNAEVESLNLAGAWLDTARSPDSLGVSFDQALAGDKAVTLSGGLIGVAGRLDPVITETRQVLAAFERLQQAASLGIVRATDALQSLSKLVSCAQALSAVSADPLGNLFRRLARGDSEMMRDLVAAVNELLALMTPARWLYRDIQLDAEIGDQGASVALTTSEGARADLLFNTAEMNAFALTLFLLLAPRLDNAMRLVVLDDPLQNMDELTVITVARALSRLLRVFPRQWQILALFHGEEDIARIQEETQAVEYALPWVRPAQGFPEGETIPQAAAVPDWPPRLHQISRSFVVALPRG